jgi:hypothetical protein
MQSFAGRCTLRDFQSVSNGYEIRIGDDEGRGRWKCEWGGMRVGRGRSHGWQVRSCRPIPTGRRQAWTRHDQPLENRPLVDHQVSESNCGGPAWPTEPEGQVLSPSIPRMKSATSKYFPGGAAAAHLAVSPTPRTTSSLICPAACYLSRVGDYNQDT